MKCPLKCCVLIVVVTLGAVWLRLPRLAHRPMHVDEAVHAEKFGSLLEKNFYRYDPDEYHGPTLNYFTLIPAWLAGAKNLAQVSEFMLRIVPVFFGVLLIPLLLLFYNGLEKRAIFFAVLLTAISPAFVFYSRYYIQETLLICVTFGVIGCGYRLFRTGKLLWAILAGVFLGLMHATKETCIIAIGSMILALALTIVLERRRKDIPPAGAAVKPCYWIVLIVSALAVSALFFSSFFTNPRGIVDSFTTYANYFNRAGHNTVHIHPWYYYLQILLYWRASAGPVWSEAFIVILAVVGGLAAVTSDISKNKPSDLSFPRKRESRLKNCIPHQVPNDKILNKFFRNGTSRAAGLGDFRLLRFLLLYTAIMTVIYAVIPYKTPWCLLGFFHGMILLGGVGAAAIWNTSKNISFRIIIAAILIAAGIHLAWQAYMANYRFFADPRNPYVYAHTTTDIFKIVDNIKDIARSTEQGNNLHIEVICPGYDYWPLPWYLRGFTNAAFYNEADYSAPPAPVVIVSPAAEAGLIKKLYELPPPGERELYVPLFESDMQLRPNMPLNGYIKKSLWDRYAQQEENLSLSGGK